MSKAIAYCRHALDRTAKRGIRLEAIDLVASYGVHLPAGDGCEKRMLNRLSQIDALCDGAPLALVEAASRIVIIQSSDGAVVTAYKRTLEKIGPKRRRRFRLTYNGRRRRGI